ncbi:hypothetical protein [Vibrio owensii]|uniref:hypothetical protein n=1 Tax=Vibrio owensii TaxID=696485 RepID=UPI003CC5850D
MIKDVRRLKKAQCDAFLELTIPATTLEPVSYIQDSLKILYDREWARNITLETPEIVQSKERGNEIRIRAKVPFTIKGLYTEFGSEADEVKKILDKVLGVEPMRSKDFKLDRLVSIDVGHKVFAPAPHRQENTLGLSL